VRRTAGVARAITVTGDGLVLAASGGPTTGPAAADPGHQLSDRLAAVAGGLVSLAHATARLTDAGDPLQVTLELAEVVAVARPLGEPGDGSLLVLARGQVDLGYLGYELAVLAGRVRRALDLDRGPGGPGGTGDRGGAADVWPVR
jgi:predicted regulator of Ras-like GTPase activity (Roadblock/LC7/MglB family)